MTNEYVKRYREKNKEKVKEIARRYAQKNKEHFNEITRVYLKNKYATNEEYRRYMNEKALKRYYEKKNPFIGECNRLMNILR